jgi:hypothetical protein
MMPISGVAHTEFTLTPVTTRNNLTSGQGYGTQLAPDYWDISIQTATANRESQRLREWRRFANALRGSMKIGLFYDADKPRPVEYIRTGLPTVTAAMDPFEGLAHIQTITDNFHITVSGLPAGFVLHMDDYFGLIEDDRYFLATIMQDVTADGSGVATINFAPELPNIFSAAADVNFEKPCCEGFLTATPDIPRDLEGGTVSLKARSRAY